MYLASCYNEYYTLIGMSIPALAKAFFEILNEHVGPFDRPIEFRVFPFDAGGALNFLTVGKGRCRFVKYVSWDLFGNPNQKRGSLGRFELLCECDSEEWCLDILTNIGRQTFETLFEPGDTLDIGVWVGSNAPLQGVLFDVGLTIELEAEEQFERAGLLRCVGITRPELEFAKVHGTEALIKRLKRSGIYPKTITNRGSADLGP